MIASLGNTPHTSKSVQIERQTVESTLVVSLSIQQLQDMITNTIIMQYDRPSQSKLMYSKLYPKMIDNLHMSISYQPSKFQSFNEKGNSKQYVVLTLALVFLILKMIF